MIPLPVSYPAWLSAERRWLGTILALSFIAHLLLFLGIELKMERPRVLPLRPSTITFVDLEGETGASVETASEDWLQWRNPAHLALPPEGLPEPELIRKALAGEYPERGTSASDQPAPFPPSPSPVTLNASLPPLDRQAAAAAQRILPEPSHQDIANPPGLGGSQYLLDGALAKRGIASAAPLPQAEVTFLPRPAVLQAGIDAGGSVIFVSIDESSGSSELDQMALKLVHRWKFKPSANAPLETGRIRIQWEVKTPP
jgi:TonB family protein